MTVTEYKITVDWSKIHEAAMAVDKVRGNLGYDGIYDVWGGSYWPPHFESRGMVGLIAVSHGAEVIARHAWKKIHNLGVHVGQRRRVSLPIDDQLAAARVTVDTALRLHQLRVQFDAAGITDYCSRQVICGRQYDAKRGEFRLNITGLAWLAGHSREPDAGPLLIECRRFAEGGPLRLEHLWPDLEEQLAADARLSTL